MVPHIRGAAAPCRILSADDIDINREILRIGLARNGYDVEFAENGLEALEKVQIGNFDMVLMDVQMPVMSGLEATWRIRLLPPPVCFIPIIALTANVRSSQVQACLSAGMNECLPKPIDWKQLLEVISRYCSKSTNGLPRA